MKAHLQALVLTLLATSILTGCGGGGGGSTASPSLDGTVAVGAPIAGASIVARGANGATSNTVIADADGKYSGLNLNGLTAPIIIEATGEFGQTPYTLHTLLNSTTSGTANVTPITSLISTIAAGTSSDSINLSSLSTSTLTAAIQQAKSTLATTLSPITSAIGLDLTTNDPVSQTFTTNNTGLDKLLDAIDIKIRKDEGISITNKFQAVQEGVERTAVSVSFTGSVTGNLPVAANKDLSWLPTMAASFNECFALPASQRVLYSNDPGGVPVASSVHNSCKSFVNSAYIHNGYSFGDRWVRVLNDSAFDNSKFKIQLAYILDSNGVDVFVVNVNFKDKDGNGYTRPEVVTQSAGSYLLYGNQRVLEAYAEPMISNIADYADSTSSINSIQGRLRFFISPHRDWDNASSGYKFYYDGNGKPDPKWACSWVTGPGLPGEGALNSAQSGPVGGILMKIPRSDYADKREYLAIAYKFPATFDPVAVQADKNQLLKACAVRENVSRTNVPSWEVATFSTDNNFTLDFAKANQTGSFSWPTSGNGNNSFNWAGNSTSYAQATGVSGYANWALAPVDQSIKDAYKPTTMPTFNFYSFRLADVPTNVYTVNGNGSIPVVNDAQANTFFSAKVVTKARMIGAMPYLKRDSNNVFAGNTKFGTISDATLASFLSASSSAISIGSTLSASWSPAAGGTGIDRLGFQCYGTWIPSGTAKKRWGPSVSSGSWGFTRSTTNKKFTFEDTCAAYSFVGTAYQNGPTSTSVYRNLWIRTYDQENTQIQQVYLAER